MFLKDLVEVNQKGNVANAVNFDMMDDPEINKTLCESFIFNYDPNKPELSTVGILERLKDSFHSRNNPNVHMMIQQYGRGKSHFAVVLANFFGKPAESPEVRGILEQVDKATSGTAKVIAEKLNSYKQRQQKHHLVFCLSGDKGGDIRKQFLRVVIKTLKAEGIEDSIAIHLCREPLEYLENLTPENRAKADAYLESLGNPDGDVNSLIRQLRKNNLGVVRTVKQVCRYVSKVTPDFQDEINVEAILRDLLDNLCSGENARFAGILILFDEMNYYLQSWAADQIGAGGTALQNITNICELYKSKIALLSFTQIAPSTAADSISFTAKEDYKKLSTRLAPRESTYDGPASSLELVIDNMLVQKEASPLWKEFLHRWDDTLLSSARDAFEKHIKTYKQRGWTLQYFYNRLSRGCFPLHPVTAYLLCSLGFTQDRTAIQFIKGYVSKFIAERSVEENERLNYIYPIDLVDTFSDNFTNESSKALSLYNRYKEARMVVAGSDNPDEERALKALFLYFASEEKITKADREDHEEILGVLSGLSRSRIKAALQKLAKTRDLIFYKPEIKLYRFWEGTSPQGIESEIEDRIRDRDYQVHKIAAYCQGIRKDLLRDTVYVADQFVSDRKLVGDDWRFEIKFYTPDTLIRDLITSERAITKGTEERGIFAYVVGEISEDLRDLRQTIGDRLSDSPNRDRIAVAIPSMETGDLYKLFLKIEELQNLDPQQKRLWGTAACDQLLQRWEEQRRKRLEQILKSCSYHCILLNKIPTDQHNQPTKIVSTLLQELYPFVPTVGGVDRLRSDHGTGKQIVGVVATQLFADSLSPQTLPKQAFYKDVIGNVFVRGWGLLKQTSDRYLPQEPTEENIKEAWSKISQLTALEGSPEKEFELRKLWQILSAPPYGYSEYNFTVLVAGWLAYHRKEVSLKGSELINGRKPPQTTTVRRLSLKEWANTDLFRDPKKFVHDWIAKAKLIRRARIGVPELPASPMDFNQAQDYLERVDNFLESVDVEPADMESVSQTSERVRAALEPINAWFQPVEQTEALPDDAPMDTLLRLYCGLRQPLPTYSLNPDIISVRPTAEQRTHHDIANQTIASRIEQGVEQVSLESENLETIAECSTYKEKVQHLIDTFAQTPELPSHLQDILQNALRVAEQVRAKLEQNVHIAKLIETAREKARSLHEHSSQADFTRVLTELDTLRYQIPADRPEVAELQSDYQEIARQYQELGERIKAWEEKLTSVSTRPQIVALLKETARYRDRFTEAESQQRLGELQKKLEQELSGIDTKSQPETLLKAELDNARQHLQRLRDLPDSKITEAFQAYEELKGFQFSSVEDTALLEKYQERLQAFKSQGHDLIANRFQQICDRQLPRLDLYENRKNLLNRVLSILENTHEFESAKTNVAQSLTALDAQAETLRQQAETQQKQSEDKQTLREIQQLKPAKISSIHACEVALTRIQELRASLHKPESAQAEISQIVQACEHKIASYKQELQKLQGQLATISSSRDLNQLRVSYVRLESAFRESSEFEAYETFGAAIADIEEDLETLDKLESRYHQANSIAACNDILEDLEQPQDLLQHPERFKDSYLVELEEKVGRKIQTYQQDLVQIEQKLAYASTPSEIYKLQEALLKKSEQYNDSEASEQFENLKQEVKILVDLIPLIDTANAASLETCKERIEQLTSWKESATEISERIQDRINAALEELEKRRKKLLLEKQETARNWLRELTENSAKIPSTVRESKRYEIANDICKRVRNSKDTHIKFLGLADRRSLQEVYNQCCEELNKHIGNQIVTLFKKLDRSKRQALHKILERYLVDQTEESLPHTSALEEEE